MRVAVVTPYYKEKLEVLERCHRSVMAQTDADVVHYMVADGFARDEVDGWSSDRLVHIRLPHHGDYGDTPRLVGTACAATKKFDAICLLDADCWFEPNHVHSLVEQQRKTGFSIVTCPRRLFRPDGSVLGIDTESDGEVFNDTNCYLVMQDAFPLFRAWGYKDPGLGIIGDRVFWDAVRHNTDLPRARSPEATVNYVTTFAVHYTERNEVPPPEAKVIVRLSGEEYCRMVSYQEYIRLMAATPPA